MSIEAALNSQIGVQYGFLESFQTGYDHGSLPGKGVLELARKFAGTEQLFWLLSGLPIEEAPYPSLDREALMPQRSSDESSMAIRVISLSYASPVEAVYSIIQIGVISSPLIAGLSTTAFRFYNKWLDVRERKASLAVGEAQSRYMVAAYEVLTDELRATRPNFDPDHPNTVRRIELAALAIADTQNARSAT